MPDVFDAKFKPSGSKGPTTKSGGFLKSTGKILAKTGKGIAIGAKYAGKGLKKGAQGVGKVGVLAAEQQKARFQRGEFEQYKIPRLYKGAGAVAREHRQRVLEKSRTKSALLQEKLSRTQYKQLLEDTRRQRIEARKLSGPGPLSDKGFSYKMKKFNSSNSLGKPKKRGGFFD